ncbi:hypothetical protein BC834DRAFT_843475 [Gloeopeniophorella convolvens]|nr:hypothetical protein BC834DRAFT_843475 [Gloeopeniophorella convolvens]
MRPMYNPAAPSAGAATGSAFDSSNHEPALGTASFNLDPIPTQALAPPTESRHEYTDERDQSRESFRETPCTVSIAEQRSCLGIEVVWQQAYSPAQLSLLSQNNGPCPFTPSPESEPRPASVASPQRLKFHSSYGSFDLYGNTEYSRKLLSDASVAPSARLIPPSPSQLDAAVFTGIPA